MLGYRFGLLGHVGSIVWRLGLVFHRPQTEKHGWVLMGADKQFEMLGVSILEALPHHTASFSAPHCEQCDSEKSLQDHHEVANAERKRLKTS